MTWALVLALLPLLAACTPSVEDAAAGAKLRRSGLDLRSRQRHVAADAGGAQGADRRDPARRAGTGQCSAHRGGHGPDGDIPVGIELRNTAPSEWTGELILPFCSQGRSDWLWTLVTQVGSGEQLDHIPSGSRAHDRSGAPHWRPLRMTDPRDW
jgi:hypothetical protein